MRTLRVLARPLDYPTERLQAPAPVERGVLPYAPNVPTEDQ